MMNTRLWRRLAGCGLLLAGVLALEGVADASGVRFSDFRPLTASAGPAGDEATPITFGNASFQQRSVADRMTQLAAGEPNSGSWDMITVNETGAGTGRYLFAPFETGQAGIQRHNVETGETATIWNSPAPGGHVAFDPSFWTPWGTYVTAEESWCSAAAGCTTSPHGRLFELTNPLTADSVTEPTGEPAELLHRNVIPRVSHEGIQFDAVGNMYFIDELNGGSLYKYVPAASWGDIMSGRAGYFDAGQTFVLRVGDGTTPNATGTYTWLPITDMSGAALPGAITITDPNGVTSVDSATRRTFPRSRAPTTSGTRTYSSRRYRAWSAST
jgi:uncharacterized protein